MSTVGERDNDRDRWTDAACCNGDTCGQDCDDSRRATNPGSNEVCNGHDDNCDGHVDDGVLGTYYIDADGDRHGAQGSSPVLMCPANAAGYELVADDCDDSNPDVWRGSQCP